MILNDHFRFKIGDVVQMIAAGKLPGELVPQPLQIVERRLHECYGGIQAVYLVRAQAPGLASGYIAFHPDLLSVTEIEVESYDYGSYVAKRQAIPH